ncbi:MAG: hypothetical protein HYV92_05575 [Candidatus Rokubacteria bacterium]|nr:hypothetical protein [Candidatus Rokubacteria bacterium]
MRLSPEVCHQARALIASRLGLDFPESRQADLERGLIRACRASSVLGPEAYLAWLAALPDESLEWRRLASHLTVGETYFFRDRALFEALEHQVLPSLMATRRAEGTRRLRLWSAGCATGEEPYSLGILVDRLIPDGPDWALTILATDINAEALEKARRGCYREWSFRETPQGIRDRYFHRRGGETFELDARIRRMVTFAPLNLAEDGYPSVVTNTSAMDLILCRNVLMYFTREAQRQTAVRLRRGLVTGGWLVVSPSEASAELFSPLVPVNFPGAILYQKEPASDAPLLTDFPARLPFVGTSDGLDTPPSPLTVPSEERAESEEVESPPALAADLDRVCQERGEMPAAMEALRRAIYLAPDSAPAQFLLGSLLLRQGKRKQGQRSMETVVSLLSPVPRDEPLAGSDGLTAGRLLETARAYLEAS